MKKFIIATIAVLVMTGAKAQTTYSIQRACHPADVKDYTTDQLRSRFMMPRVM